MKRSRAAFLVVGLGLLVAVQAICTSLLLAPDGARIQWPESGSSHGREFVASGDAWAAPGQDSIASISVVARPSPSTGGEPLAFPAARAYISLGRQPRYALPTWTARLVVPQDGEWTLRAVAITTDGRRIESGERALRVTSGLGGVADSGFASWSAPHLFAIGAILLGAFVVAYFARKGGPSWLARAAPYIAFVMWANELAYQSYWMAVGGWSHSVSLMLQMCGLSIVFIPICLFMSDGPRTAPSRRRPVLLGPRRRGAGDLDA